MTTEPADTGIKLIPGKNPILLIAPHGMTKDDTNTDKLTKEMAKRLGCYAVINERYQRPHDVEDPKTKEKSKGPADPANNRYDLNNLDHLLNSKELTEDFLKPIIKFKDEIKATAKNTKPLVILVHGIDDDKISAHYGQDKDIVVGRGQFVKDPDKKADNGKTHRYTCKVTKSDKLIGLLAEAVPTGINAVYSHLTPSIEAAKTYGGWDRRNLNQLFTFKDSAYKDLAVQSIQLEIKKAGFRVPPENIESTAERLSMALAELAGIELAKSEENLPAAITDTALAVKEEKVDEDLVREAYGQISFIFLSCVGNALEDIGEYIIKYFWDNDYERAKSSKPIKSKSFRHLIHYMREQDNNLPSEAWLYRSKQMAIEIHELEKLLPKKIFYTYRTNLSLSHKVLLLPITDIEAKKKYIELIDTEELTVAQFREMLPNKGETERPALAAPTSITKAISKPDMLFSDTCSGMLTPEYLSKLPAKQVATIRTKAEAQIKALEEEMKKSGDYIKRYKELIAGLGKGGNAN